MGWVYSAVVVAPSYRDPLARAARWLGFKAQAIRPPSIWPKLMTAETWVQSGTSSSGQREPLRVSANTAPITQTRSIAHPVLTLRSAAPPHSAYKPFPPAQSQTLNGLLAVHDWLHPTAPQPGKIRVHGGIHTLPYPMDTALRVAAAIGFTQSPQLLGSLLKR